MRKSGKSFDFSFCVKEVMLDFFFDYLADKRIV